MKVKAHEGFEGVDIQLTRQDLEAAIHAYVLHRGLILRGEAKVWVDGASRESAATIQYRVGDGLMMIPDPEKMQANGHIEFC